MYTAANWYLVRRGAQHRKKGWGHQASEAEQGGSGPTLLATAHTVVTIEIFNSRTTSELDLDYVSCMYPARKIEMTTLSAPAHRLLEYSLSY